MADVGSCAKTGDAPARTRQQVKIPVREKRRMFALIISIATKTMISGHRALGNRNLFPPQNFFLGTSPRSITRSGKSPLSGRNRRGNRLPRFHKYSFRCRAASLEKAESPPAVGYYAIVDLCQEAKKTMFLQVACDFLAGLQMALCVESRRCGAIFSGASVSVKRDVRTIA